MALRPAATQEVTTDNYVSTLDLHQPDIRKELVVRYGGQTMTEFFELTSRMEPTTQTEYEHFEEDFIMWNVKASGSTGAGVAGATVVVTIHVDDHDGSSGEFSYPLVNELIQFTNDVIAIISAKDETTPGAHTISLTPLKAAESIPAITANDLLLIFADAHAEGSAQPKGRTPRVINYKNNTQIFKESYEVTGSEMTNLAWVEVQDSAGRTGFLWYLKGEKDTYERYRVKKELGLLLNEKADNIAALAPNRTFTTTEGMLPFINNNGGIVHNYTPGTFTLTNFDQIIKKLDKQFGSYENTVWMGIDIRQETDDFIMDLMKAGGVSYGAFNGDKELAIKLQFQSLARLGYVFHFKTYKMFNHPNLLGTAGYKYPGHGIVIPMDNVKDAITREMSPSVRVRYKQVGPYSRDTEHWLTGSAFLKNKTDDVDVLRAHYRAECGFEGFGPNKFVHIKSL